MGPRHFLVAKTNFSSLTVLSVNSMNGQDYTHSILAGLLELHHFFH
jgi:hypothetical protein